MKLFKFKKIITVGTLASIMLSSLPMSVSAVSFNNIRITGNENGSKFPKYLTGEIHNHTMASNDAFGSMYNTFENILNAAFREDLENFPEEGDPSFDYGKSFDFLMTADHLRNSDHNVDGTENKTATWEKLKSEVEIFNEYKEKGKYKDKIYYPGFEWDMFGLDHASVAILDKENEFPVNAYRQFEWLYAYDTSDDMFYNNELEDFGPRQNEKSNKENTFKGLKFLQDNYPKSFVIANHPSRHEGDGKGEVKIEDLRRMSDTAPDVFIGFEGMPGNQMGGDRGELKDIYGGADKMIAEVGGVWDSLLGEGRKFYNFTNADFHFKISNNKDENPSRMYTSGYWPSEYSKNYIYAGNRNFHDVVKGIKSGNILSLYGDLVRDFEFSINDSKDQVLMGSELKNVYDDEISLNIRFRESDFNNYKKITHGKSNVESATNTPKLDHIDVIAGEITGKVDDPTTSTNPTTKVIKRINRTEFGPQDKDGFYNIKLKLDIDKDMYFRLRGTNLGLNVEGKTDEFGNPLVDKIYSRDNYTDYEIYFNDINNRNYRDLWFYSNPIFVYKSDKPYTPIVDNDDNSNDEAHAFDYLVSNDNKDVLTKEVYAGFNKTTSEKTSETFEHKSYISGYPDNTVRPDQNVTRAEAITMVVSLENYNISDNSKPVFSDTDKTWYAPFINAAYKENILEEKSNEEFRPNDIMTRAELAKLISHLDKDNNSVAPFEDIKGHKYEAAINKSFGNGRIQGYPDGTFKPDEGITRAETAVILNSLYDRKVNSEGLQNINVNIFKDINKDHWAYYEIVESSHTHKYTRDSSSKNEMWKEVK